MNSLTRRGFLSAAATVAASSSIVAAKPDDEPVTVAVIGAVLAART